MQLELDDRAIKVLMRALDARRDELARNDANRPKSLPLEEEVEAVTRLRTKLSDFVRARRFQWQPGDLQIIKRAGEP